jgi:hypothetical protein
MNVYMLEDTKTGMFYRRRGSAYQCWVEQKDASIWTSRRGPAQAMTYVSKMKKRQPVIRTFKLEPCDE